MTVCNDLVTHSLLSPTLIISQNLISKKLFLIVIVLVDASGFCTVRESQGKVSSLLKSGKVMECQGNLQWSEENGTFILHVREYILIITEVFYFLAYIQSLSFSMFYH